MKDLYVRYLGGSGFLVSVGETGLLFDASETDPNGGNDPRKLPTAKELESFENLYVFVSHQHADHFSDKIYSLCPENTVYFLGYDVPEEYRGFHMKAGESQDYGNLKVEAFGSTEEGVSFLVSVSGIRIFHAGDLNLWHWRDESTIPQIEAAEKAFYECVEPIPRNVIDLAMFPVDPRQGSLYDAGAGYFIMTVKPKVLIPMHFCGRSDVAVRFAVGAQTAFTKVAVLERPDDAVSLHIPESEDSAPDKKLKDFLKQDAGEKEDGADGEDAEEK